MKKVSLTVTMFLLIVSSSFAQDRLCFDFEKDLQGWRVVVGDLRGCRTSSKKARLPETGKYLIAIGPRAILESPVFTVKGTEATFLLGGSGGAHAYLSLHAEDCREIMRPEVASQLQKKDSLLAFDLWSLTGWSRSQSSFMKHKET